MRCGDRVCDSGANGILKADETSKLKRRIRQVGGHRAAESVRGDTEDSQSFVGHLIDGHQAGTRALSCLANA